MRGPRTREVLLWPTALTVNNSRAVPTTWQSETQWTTRREEKKNSSDTETLNRWDVYFYLIVVVLYYLVNGTTEVWNTNIWSRHKDTSGLIVVSYTRPISPSKVKEGIPAYIKDTFIYDMVVEACLSVWLHTTTHHPNLTKLFLSSLWSDLSMWGQFLIVLNFRNKNLRSSLS